MKSTITSYRHFSRKASRSGMMLSLYAFFDHIIRMVSNRSYYGDNPAVAVIYSPLRTGLIVMLLLFFIIFGLGSTVPIESAVVAKGNIVVISDKKTVQHLEGGIISKILVKEGDVVTKGQPLIILNDVAPQSTKDMVQSELYADRVTEARINDLKNHLDSLTIPPDIVDAAQKDQELAGVISSQKDFFTTQKDTLAGKLKTLKQHIEQSKEEIIGLQAQVQSAEGQLGLIAQEVKPMSELVQKGYAALPQLLTLERQEEQLKGDRGQYIASIAKAKQSIAESELQIDNAQNDFDTKNAEDLRDIQSKIGELEEKLQAASDVLKRTTIISPYDGIVNGLKVHTIGGVITAGAPIMDIIPQNEELLVEAQIPPSNIDSIKSGLPAKISFSVYKTRSLPRISGEVIYVSADVFNVQEGPQNVSYYLARIKVNNEELSRLKTEIKLYPGMPVEAFINTGSRSFLGYMFAPIINNMGRAFKED